MIGHLGARVSALLDGQLSPAEAERAWAHVHQCHACRDLVEREGWIKSRLAGLSSSGAESAPLGLAGALAQCGPTRESHLGSGDLLTHRPRSGVAFLGGTAVGVVVAGVVALSVAPGAAPVERRPPTTSLNIATVTPASRPAGGPAPVRVGPAIGTQHVSVGIPGVKISR